MTMLDGFCTEALAAAALAPDGSDSQAVIAAVSASHAMPTAAGRAHDAVRPEAFAPGVVRFVALVDTAPMRAA